MRNCIGTFTISVEKQTEPARAQRTAREISLHLRLVGAEIGEREKKAAKNAGPKRVAPVRIDREIDRLEFSHFAGDRERVCKGMSAGNR